jgi:hypothetical protein
LPNSKEFNIHSIQTLLSVWKVMSEDVQSDLASFLEKKEHELSDTKLRRCRITMSNCKETHAQSLANL